MALWRKFGELAIGQLTELLGIYSDKRPLGFQTMKTYSCAEPAQLSGKSSVNWPVANSPNARDSAIQWSREEMKLQACDEVPEPTSGIKIYSQITLRAGSPFLVDVASEGM